MLTIWVDESPVIELDDGRATISFTYNGERMAFTMKRATLRPTVERGKRYLDAADRQQQGQIAFLRQCCPLPPDQRCG